MKQQLESDVSMKFLNIFDMFLLSKKKAKINNYFSSCLEKNQLKIKKSARLYIEKIN